ncbi:MAG: SoxR reducing system RseC family protein [Bacteroidales bacterium]|nr:SoxR reducing system RseC family protein [Bacteroidales bacterium]
MKTQNQITHDGFVDSIDTDTIYVRIIAMAGCVSCSANSSCSVSDIEEKIVEVRNNKNQSFKIGDRVVVALNQNQGFTAVFIGYLLPFLILLITLITILSFTDNQGIAGLISLAMLIPYYFMVFLFRKSIRNRFSFQIK